ncbi:MAG TPA: hypothetical protein VIM65_05270 [Cyclobacteriaceae bacterium]
MDSGSKTFETGSNPYHLNLNSTAKDFSLADTTNPSDSLLDILSKFILIEDQYVIHSDKIQNDFIIEKE